MMSIARYHAQLLTTRRHHHNKENALSKFRCTLEGKILDQCPGEEGSPSAKRVASKRQLQGELP
jgi:hypothetical protein